MPGTTLGNPYSIFNFNAHKQPNITNTFPLSNWENVLKAVHTPSEQQRCSLCLQRPSLPALHLSACPASARQARQGRLGGLTRSQRQSEATTQGMAGAEMVSFKCLVVFWFPSATLPSSLSRFTHKKGRISSARVAKITNGVTPCAEGLTLGNKLLYVEDFNTVCPHHPARVSPCEGPLRARHPHLGGTSPLQCPSRCTVTTETCKALRSPSEATAAWPTGGHVVQATLAFQRAFSWKHLFEIRKETLREPKAPTKPVLQWKRTEGSPVLRFPGAAGAFFPQ